MKLTSFIMSLFIKGLAHKQQNEALLEICDNITKSYENYGFEEVTFIKDDSFDQDNSNLDLEIQNSVPSQQKNNSLSNYNKSTDSIPSGDPNDTTEAMMIQAKLAEALLDNY